MDCITIINIQFKSLSSLRHRATGIDDIHHHHLLELQMICCNEYKDWRAVPEQWCLPVEFIYDEALAILSSPPRDTTWRYVHTAIVHPA